MEASAAFGRGFLQAGARCSATMGAKLRIFVRKLLELASLAAKCMADRIVKIMTTRASSEREEPWRSAWIFGQEEEKKKLKRATCGLRNEDFWNVGLMMRPAGRLLSLGDKGRLWWKTLPLPPPFSFESERACTTLDLAAALCLDRRRRLYYMDRIVSSRGLLLAESLLSDHQSDDDSLITTTTDNNYHLDKGT